MRGELLAKKFPSRSLQEISNKRKGNAMTYSRIDLLSSIPFGRGTPSPTREHTNPVGCGTHDVPKTKEYRKQKTTSPEHLQNER